MPEKARERARENVRFLSDYRGVLTAERFYGAGDTAYLPPDAAVQLEGRGIAEAVHDGPAPAGKPSLKDENVKTLRELAKAAGIKGYQRMKHATLVAKLS